jgi:protein involved in polysaccharide export with SLBB domain
MVFRNCILPLAALAMGAHAMGQIGEPAATERMFGLPEAPAQAVKPRATPGIINWDSPTPTPTPAAGEPVMAAQPVASPTPEPIIYTSMESLDDKRKLTIGDHISYRVIEDKNPAESLMVTDAGDIEVPLLGRVAAAGKTCRELATEMKPVLEKTYFYKATVIVALDMATQKSPGHIYVTGVVIAPGPQDMPPNEVYTLSKAITRAGGVAQFGNDHRVKIVRRNADGTMQNMEVDVGEIINKGRIDKDPVLQPEDMIVVPRKLINF